MDSMRSKENAGKKKAEKSVFPERKHGWQKKLRIIITK
jgi:hypothetical protein